MRAAERVIASAGPPVSWADLLRSRSTEAGLSVTVDLRDLDHRPVDVLRLLLVADVLRRIVEEIVGVDVTSVIVPHGVRLPRPFEPLSGALRILPATARRTSSTQEFEPSRQPAGITIVSTDRSRPVEPASAEPLLLVGAVLPRGIEHVLVQQLAARDPLTARLALLRFAPSATAVLSTARLHRAGETLDRWRFKVANWKDAPPAPAEALDILLGLLVNDCDTATVLRLLHRIETDHGVPSGAKYQTFVHLDRVLGLDLTRRQYGPNVW